ncbi:hypothetical protein A5646_03545 [Mycobacterium sp. 1245499.0]|uniref:hypothetical protein n=1 Tax=Mycobacterium sp. 1245499.0 TaxID=1834074 RepID=UPI0007FCA4F2|nr:hypothetical protein [Mycobacterium sp. 1245499.0]OBK92388.1 hypothetical protein A5646_03545 [Mycobacterium sp. 1245499.0]
MLTTLGFIALAIGVILVLIGYTIEHRAIRPGWACIITALILILTAALLDVAAGPNYRTPGVDSPASQARAEPA